MKFWIGKLVRAPRTLAYLIVDRVVAPVYLAICGVKVSSALYLSGLPRVKMITGGYIKLGQGVKLFSRPRSNPLQLWNPCSFYLLKSDAMIEVGDQVAMSGTVICAAECVTIGKRVLIGANCTISDTDFHPLSAADRRIHPTDGALHDPIIIGDDVFIGTRAIILKGTRLGDSCVVGAGAVVSGDFPPGSVIVGNPGKIIKTIDLE